MRIFIEYTLWDSIVIAITISSVFFAFEDLFHLLYQTQKKSCDITENFIIKVKEKNETAISFFKKLDEKADEYEGSEYDLIDMQTRSIPQKTRIEEILRSIGKIQELNLNDRKKEKRLRRISHIFAYIGFLFLFLSLILFTQIPLPSLIQEIITVFSFAIILVTQQINNHAIKKIEDENKQINDILQKVVEEDEVWVKLKEGFDEFVKHADKNLHLEESKNAN